jgi:hypothetical protein
MTGSWYIVATTLPFWRRRGDPSVHYDTLADGRWRDTVQFHTEHGASKRIVGYDTFDIENPGALVWHGSGLLAWCRSRWCFIDADPDAGWALTWFSAATLRVTPAGCDLYSRKPGFDIASARAIVERAEDALGVPLAPGWFMTHRSGQPHGGVHVR